MTAVVRTRDTEILPTPQPGEWSAAVPLDRFLADLGDQAPALGQMVQAAPGAFTQPFSAGSVTITFHVVSEGTLVRIVEYEVSAE